MSNATLNNTFFLDLTALLIRNKQQIIAIATDLSLTGIQAMTLLMLDDTNAPTMSYLCRQFECDAGNMTGIIDGLEQKGLVSRQVSIKDRRVKIIQLEPAGTAMQTAILDRLQNSGAHLFMALSTDEQQQLAGLLRKLAA